MEPFAATEDVTLYCADALEGLAALEAGSVQACVTSPPYFALRDYGVEGQLGLEAVPSDYVLNLVRAFRGVRRALRDDGTVWLNIGDSYARNPAKGQHKAGAKYKPGKQQYIYERGGGRASATFDLKRSGLKEKDLLGIPWRAALALQQPWLTCQECGAEEHASQWGMLRGQWRLCPACEALARWEITEPGWYLRGDVVWHKPNAMPNSVKDRPVTDHEYVFLLAKSPRYHFDYQAIKEAAVDGSRRSKRTVWSVNTESRRRRKKGAHFAVFPPALITPMVLASAPEGALVLDPFLGSGTTALVARQQGRKAVGIEINAEYCQLACERLGIAPALQAEAS
jgi:DNA modification methylase